MILAADRGKNLKQPIGGASMSRHEIAPLRAGYRPFGIAIAVAAAAALTAASASATVLSSDAQAGQSVVENTWSSFILKPVWLPPNPCTITRCTR